MSYDPHILDVPCNCVDSARENLLFPVCPLCGGSEKLVDLNFDLDGNFQVVTGLSKLQQDILKIMLSYIGSNELYTNYGCDVELSIGQKNLGTHTQIRLQQDVVNALNYLKQKQKEQQEKFKNLDPEETLDTIQSVVVEAVSETAYVIYVVFTTVASATSSVATTVGSPIDKTTQQEAIDQILGRSR